MDFDDGKSSDDMIINATMSDDEEVASHGPQPSLFQPTFSRFSIAFKNEEHL